MKLITNYSKDRLEEEIQESRVLKSFMISNTNKQRRHCESGGTKPAEVALQICPFCQHFYTDVVPKNSSIQEHNKKVIEECQNLLQSYDSFKRGEGPAPLKANGQARTRKPPTPKYK